MVQVENDVVCSRCNDQCYGDVINVQGRFYHQYCFSCKSCQTDLLESGYFFYEDEFYCSEDYHKLTGSTCGGCHKFVEGEAVNVCGTFFHPDCFGCVKCGKLFPPGVNIVFDGEDYVCEVCNQPYQNKKPENETIISPRSEGSDSSTSCCAGCGNDIKSGQALLALEKQWHLWCFTCFKCGCLLAGEYMGRDGVPYCEQDYQSEFGVCCAGCSGYITGKVLQAGEKHYHPHCSRCAKCDQMFGEGEEMYLQGSEIWHPHCSEEYQRENQISEQSKEEVDTGSSTNRVFNIHTRIASSSSASEESTMNNDHYANGFSSSVEKKTTSPPSYAATIGARPAGFRSVKPPQPITKQTENSDDDDAPPKPPPPSRSSSNTWRQKYTPGVYSATPFHKHVSSSSVDIPTSHRPSSTYVEQNENQTLKAPRAMSYIESAVARSSSSDESKTRMVSTSSSSSKDADDEKDGTSPTDKSVQAALYKKRMGVNKLQMRISQKSQDVKTPNHVDNQVTNNGEENSLRTTYPYEVLKTNSHRTPFDVNKHKLETYLSDRDFYNVFGMSREKYSGLPRWKQDDLKRESCLF